MSYIAYLNTFLIFIVSLHICTVLFGFERVDKHRGVKHNVSSTQKHVEAQTDVIEKKSECIETCSCDE